MKTLLASAALLGAAFTLPATATTATTGSVVDNSVIEKKCKRGYGKNSAGKCVKIPRGSGGSQPRGSY